MSDEDDFEDIDKDDDDQEEENITDLFDVVIADPTPADKRAHHNALERKRRDHIKDSFSSLLNCIPDLTTYKNSRAQTLKKATDYIVMMKNKNKKLFSDLETLRMQNKSMEHQVNALEKIKATSVFAISKDMIQSYTPTEGADVVETDDIVEEPVKEEDSSDIYHVAEPDSTVDGDCNEPVKKRVRAS